MEKSAKFIIDVSAETKRIFNSSVRFFSKDHRTAKFLIQAEKGKVSIPKDSISRVEILFESVDISYTPTGKVIFNDDMTIEENGLFSYVLPDELLNYNGLMAFEVYIYYVNEEAADSSNRIIYEQRVSAIDRVAGQVELVYIKDMEQAKQAVQDKADEVMAVMAGYESSLADYEHHIKDGMDQLYDSVAKVSTDEITKIRAELPKVETAATEEITKIQAVLPAVQATAADETAKIKAQLPIVEAVAMAETEKIQAELPKVASVTTDEISKIKAELPKVQSVTAEETTKIQSELPHVQTVATEEIGKIRDVLSTVENAAQEVSDHADQKIAEYDAKFVSTDQKMVELEQSQVALDAELKATQQQIIDADVYTKAEADANAEGILDKRNLSPAWSWSKDGTDRFSTVYPNLNLLDGTRDFSGTWLNSFFWQTDGTYKDLTVKKTTGKWNGIYKTFTAPKDGTYTFSSYVKSSGNMANIYRFGGINSTSNEVALSKPIGNSFDWTRDSITLNLKVNDNVWIKYEITGSGTDSILWTAGHKYEQGSTATPYMQSASEVTTADWPTYKGLRLAPSDNPSDYDWSYTDEYVDYLKSSSVSKAEFNDLAARLAALENQGGI